MSFWGYSTVITPRTWRQYVCSKCGTNIPGGACLIISLLSAGKISKYFYYFHSSGFKFSRAVVFKLCCLCTPDIIFFNFVPPKLLAYNSSCAQSIVHI
jgi:hypothetical protein